MHTSLAILPLSEPDLQLQVAPYAHQITGIEQIIQNKEGFANFSEQGTGKSIMAIGAMNALNLQHVLIVCPNSLKLNWQEEIQSKSKRPWEIFIPQGPKATMSRRLNQFVMKKAPHKAIITNYESLDKLQEQIKSFDPQLIIADEATAIKNHRAIRTKALKKISAFYRLAMTGTPVANSPLDVWSIIDWIRPGYLGKNFYAFRHRYCDVYTGGGFPVIKRFLRTDELREKVSTFSFRVLKKECLDLPEKVFIKRTFELSTHEASIYKQMAEDMVAEIEEKEIAAPTLLVKMLRLQQLTSGFIKNGPEPIVHVGKSKIENLFELLDELKDQKVLIWAKFKEEINQIVAMCRDTQRRCYRFTGDESIEERQEIVSQFQTLEDNAILVGIPAVGGVGITLTAASYCIYYSNSFSYTERIQSQDRIHRIGQKNCCTYYDLVALKTIDQYILNALDNKEKFSDSITGDQFKKIIYGQAK